MAVQPPKIDNRTEADIVNQTVALAQYYTSWVDPTPEALRDRILDEDLRLDGTTYAPGTLVTPEDAVKICGIWEGNSVVWVTPTTEALGGRILDEELTVDGTTYARGTLVTPEKAVTICEKPPQKKIKVKGPKIKVKGWNSLGQTPQPDAGLALIKIFGRMASQISDRLNQSLNKNFLAFLDIIGTQIQPPRAARVPLTFELATGSTSALVPAGTQVAAPPREGEEEEVIFETEKDLMMTSVQLQAVFVHDPPEDKYSDRTSYVTGKEDEAFLAFAGDRPVEHSFYIAQDDLFTLAAPKQATLTINNTNVAGLAALPITWSYWDGTVWQLLYGIIEGLTVVVDASRNKQVSVKPGKALRYEEINLSQEKTIDLSGKSNEKVIIVISSNAGKPVVQAEAVSETSTNPPADNHICLADVTVDASGNISNIQQGKDGITEGLTVVKGSQKQVKVQPGKAVSTQIVLREQKTIPLSGHKGENIIIVISSKAGNPVVEAISETSINNPADTYIRLAYLTIDSQGQISKPSGSAGNWEVKLGNISKSSGSAGNWEVKLGNLPVPTKKKINGTNAAWLKGQLNQSLPPNADLPKVSSIKARVQCDRSGLAPDFCFYNTTAIDLSKDFYPFGERPSFNDTLYLASEDVFSKAGMTVTVNLTFSKGLREINTKGKAEILWEAWNGTIWEVVVKNPDHVNVANFKKDGSVILTLPATMAPCEVNGETNYWVRARLIKGDYGTEQALDILTNLKANANKGQKELMVNDVRGFMPRDKIVIALGKNLEERNEISTVNTSENKITLKNDLKETYATGTSVFMDRDLTYPPSVKSLKLSYSYNSGDRPLEGCVTYNNFTYIDRTRAAASSSPGDEFPLFTSTTETRPALYLGFDKPFANQLNTVYLRVAPPKPGEVAQRKTVTEPAKVVWEYARSPKTWQLLEASDETESFRDRGLIKFIGPTDFSCCSEFGQQLYWLRGRWESGEFSIQPRLQRILTNTIWASQTATLQQEILGSSNGNPNQTFFTSQSPVLKGQRLEVREQSVPPLAEKIAIEDSEGHDAIAVILDEAGQPNEVWVRWHEVTDFYGSGPRDRHYVLDRQTGEVRFGNGQYGMVPPILRSNIRMASYQTGGGKRGNRKAKTIAQLKTTVPYVDSVTNLEAASGGAQGEALERVIERGPKSLRHRNRAVTAEDIEDLAFEASAEVARVKAITPQLYRKEFTWLPIYNLTLNASGDIMVTVTVSTPAKGTLNVIASGPGPGVSKPPQEISWDRVPNSNQVTFSVNTDDYALGNQWRVYLTTECAELVRGQITIQYPGGTINKESFTNLRALLRTDAGQISVIVVSNSDAIPPTPSLGLINQVEAYLKARCSATLTQLRITEPDWVYVNVTATIVPISYAIADRARTAVRRALIEFLHPITGGQEDLGWPFGRKPQDSDLYALLEGLPEVDRVDCLSIVCKAIADDGEISQLNKKHLIFSGNHQITLSNPNSHLQSPTP